MIPMTRGHISSPILVFRPISNAASAINSPPILSYQHGSMVKCLMLCHTPYTQAIWVQYQELNLRMAHQYNPRFARAPTLAHAILQRDNERS
jgi:hypothetical protein